MIRDPETGEMRPRGEIPKPPPAVSDAPPTYPLDQVLDRARLDDYLIDALEAGGPDGFARALAYLHRQITESILCVLVDGEDLGADGLDDTIYNHG